jgi:hypothetical protein
LKNGQRLNETERLLIIRVKKFIPDHVGKYVTAHAIDGTSDLQDRENVHIPHQNTGYGT